MTVKRTQDEIAERIRAVEDSDFFGFRREVLLDALDFDHARLFLKDGLTAEDWGPVADIDTEAREYHQFALKKIRDHRGISASRSVDKLTEYAWLLGRDDVVAAMDAAPYPQYGAPKVKAFADGFELAWPDSDDMTRMANGESCTPTCDEGCGS